MAAIRTPHLPLVGGVILGAIVIGAAVRGRLSSPWVWLPALAAAAIWVARRWM